ncbi:MAG: SO_0444 family Cu/Zn efflux transporter [Planctomycetota bacterium]
MLPVLVETLRIVYESAIYLLFGFALAGVLHVVLSRTPRFIRLLSGKGSRSVVLAALLGVPLPLCSCGVVPAAMTLRRKGASKGATVSFLISVPETDIVSILLTYGLLGPVMAVLRPLAAVVIAIVTGVTTNIVDRWSKGNDDAGQAESTSCCGCEGESESKGDYNPDKGALWNALNYGFVRFFDDIIGVLVLGIVLGGLITALLPSIGIERFGGGSFLTMLAMVVIGIPMYVCATASTPIAAGLILGGLSPGAALVFLLVGPATNLGSLLVLAKQLGRPVVVVYLCSISVLSVSMGLWLDSAFAAGEIVSPLATAAHGAEAASPFKIAGSILLLVLAFASFRRSCLFTSVVGRVSRLTGLRLDPKRTKVGILFLLVLAYVCSGFFIVRPGERGMMTRFGGIVRRNLQPGLHYAWPYPIGRVDIESVTEIKQVELGFRRSPASAAAGSVATNDESARLRLESWMLTGHEDIIDIKWVVQYCIRDSERGVDLERYLYRIANPEAMVRCAADSAIRVAVGQRGMDTLLTTARGEVEADVKQRLQASLDACDAGIVVVQVGLIDVHAPAEVHEAFREVASASEEKMEKINVAEEFRERVMLEAEGTFRQRILAAEGKARELVDHAMGLGAAFKARREAYRWKPTITRLRLYFEAMDVVLPGLKKYVCLSSAISNGIDLWLVEGGAGRIDLPMFPSLDNQRKR